MVERFTDDARQAMQLANQEAQRYNHEYIGTEHILLGLMRAQSSAVARVLKEFKLNPHGVRAQIERIIQRAPDALAVSRLPQTPRAKKVIEYAIQEARNLHRDAVGPEHLLLGLLCEEEGVASRVLNYLGLQRDELRDYLRGNRKTPPAQPSEPEPLSSLPEDVQQQVRDLDVQIEQLNREKEAAVAASDFEKAATLRDRSDRLRKKRQILIREAHEKQKETGDED